MFYDRQEAGQKLVQALEKYKNNKDVIVLALPRGGVVVAKEVARELKLPLNVVVSRKIGAPDNPEFAIGAVSEKGEIILNESAENYGISDSYINKEAKAQREEIKRRLAEYRGNRKSPNLKNKVIILVDDGIATGASIKAAISSIKLAVPKKLIVAIPVAPPDIISELEKEADETIVLDLPEMFFAVGQFYESFEQISDDEVKKILKEFE